MRTCEYNPLPPKIRRNRNNYLACNGFTRQNGNRKRDPSCGHLGLLAYSICSMHTEYSCVYKVIYRCEPWLASDEDSLLVALGPVAVDTEKEGESRWLFCDLHNKHLASLFPILDSAGAQCSFLECIHPLTAPSLAGSLTGLSSPHGKNRQRKRCKRKMGVGQFRVRSTLPACITQDMQA